jgi:hypothetical protein
VLRSVASADALRLTLEGRAGEAVDLPVHTDRQAGAVSAPGVEVMPVTIAMPGPGATPAFVLRVAFDGEPDRSGYVRREIVVPLR